MKTAEPTPIWRFEIRWARAYGWLAIRDPATGEWHEVLARDCPDHWRRIASAHLYDRQG